MELHTGSLYWESTLERKLFNRRTMKEQYDVAIIGGGMSGALVSFVLAGKGLSVLLIEQEEVGTGSTSANTGLLQFSNDIMLHELIGQIGEEEAVQFYGSCKKAMDRLRKMAEQMPLDVQFHSRRSLYYASEEEDVPRLREEFEVLKKHGFPVEWWNRDDIERHFSFSKSAAIVTEGDAEVNPLRLCRGAVRYAVERGMDVLEHTEVLEILDDRQDAMIRTADGEIRAKYVVATTGYTKTPDLQVPQKELKVTYALATKPLKDLSFWHGRMMIWETKRPYLYMRLTDDNRIIVGGLDEDIDTLPDKGKRQEKCSELLAELRRLFPDEPIQQDFCWSAVFGESTDELPVIGRHPDERHIYYLIGLGGNGTVYSMLGAKLIADLLEKEDNPDEPIVQVER